MNITEIGGQHFMTLKDPFRVELDQRGLILIQGVNSVDSSASSNGAGKSSVPDALCWACYGVTAREVTGDAVVNRDAKKDTHVYVIIKDGGMTYQIDRYRKHATKKNAVFVTQIDPAGVKTDLTKGTDKETQFVIDAVMGASVDVFCAAIYAGQEKMPDLPGMTDKTLKMLLEEASGTQELEACYAEARAQATAAKRIVEDATQNHAKAVAAVSTIEAEVARLQGQSDEFEAGRRDRAKAHLAKVPGENALIDAINTELASLDEEGTTAAIKSAQAVLASVESEKAKQRSLTDAVRAAERLLTQTQADVARMKNEVAKATTALANVDSQVGKPCGECGKPYCEHDLEGARQRAADRLKEWHGALADATNVAADKETAFQAAEKELADFTAGMTDVSAASSELTKLSAVARDIVNKKASIAPIQTRIEAHKATAANCLKEANPYTAAIAGRLSAVEKAKADVIAAQEKIEKEQERFDLLQEAVKVFGPAGVRAHILDLVTPFLNDKTRDYLGALSDGHMHAVWSTLAKTAKGELKEKFNIEVTSDTGGDDFKALSGGEKRKVRLATAMALQDLVASRASKPINLFVADEIDHALDENGLERLMGILDNRAKERGTVMVISHNSLADWIDQVITVEKKEKYSSNLTGATTAMF